MAGQDRLLKQLLGQYRVEKVIGEGGMAIVYQGRRSGGTEIVALKVLRPECARDPNMHRLFIEEGQATRQLEDPHIVRVFDVGEVRGHYYMVMEHMARGDLKRYLQHHLQSSGHGLTMREALYVAIHTARGLDYIHRRGVIHRDINLRNLLVGANGEVKITDFSAARYLSKGAAPQGGGIIGTPAYIAPEQAMNAQQVDPRADIYSLGVVLYELLAGRLHLDEKAEPIVIIHQQTDEKPPALTDFNRHIPVSIQKIVNRAMEKRPEQRYQSAAEMADALAKALCDLKPSIANIRPAAGGQGDPQARPGPPIIAPPQMPACSSSSRLDWRMIAAGVVVCLGVLWFFLSGPTPSSRPPTPRATQESPVVNASTPEVTVSTASLAVTATLTPTRTPTRTPTPTVPLPTTEPSPTLTPTPAEISAPVLLAPVPDHILYLGESTEFSWRWDGEEIQNTKFEVLIWHGNSDHLGAYNAATMGVANHGRGTYSVSFKLEESIPGIAANPSQRNFLWSVVLVETSPYKRISPEAATHPFSIAGD
jgi:serine/threonine protein kinase